RLHAVDVMVAFVDDEHDFASGCAGRLEQLRERAPRLGTGLVASQEVVTLVNACPVQEQDGALLDFGTAQLLRSQTRERAILAVDGNEPGAALLLELVGCNPDKGKGAFVSFRQGRKRFRSRNGLSGS